MRTFLTFILLMGSKLASLLFYRFDVEWVGDPGPDRWKGIRVIAILHHTSLYEPVFAAIAPWKLLWKIAGHGVIPVADKTMNQPASGLLFRFVGAHVVSVSRKRDATWQKVLDHFGDPKAITVILPEGRMMRRDGLDSEGRPMTLRGGVADLLRGVDQGKLLLVYSGGLHQIHAPGDRFPRLFKRVSARLETIDIPEYCASLRQGDGRDGFKRRVVDDLTRRRNEHCPLSGPTRPEWAA
jgi:hypothetical protein